ncbi:hypothetical protein I4U23_004986 [Adineta vaga]|nr:hypothetical protein I4U23_004986 [Adineta vaga]
MSNSTTTDTITSTFESTITSISIHIMTYGGIFLLVAGNIGCVGNILVFRSEAYRRQACFIYLFWETIASLFILDCILLTRILQNSFHIPLMSASEPFCRIREFISLFMYQNENTLFLYAALDRILCVQRSAKLRKWSNRVPLAYKIIVLNALLWLVLSGHRLIYYTVIDGFCWSQQGIYRTFDTYLDVSLSAIGSPLLVIILASLLWYNIRSMAKRRAALHSQTPNHEMDSQLTIMLFLQSIIAIINYVPFGAFSLYFMFTDEWIKSSFQIAVEDLIIVFVRLSSYLFAAGSFYVSILSNRSFRKQCWALTGTRRRLIHPATITSTGNPVRG